MKRVRPGDQEVQGDGVGETEESDKENIKAV